MKLRTLALLLALLPLVGCGAVSAPATPPAPGYSSSADQTLGQSLAALNAFVLTEKSNYQCDAAALARATCLTAAQQSAEKAALNSFIDAVTVANAAYSAFHVGTGTLAAAQSTNSSATTAQSNLATIKAAH